MATPAAKTTVPANSVNADGSERTTIPASNATMAASSAFSMPTRRDSLGA
jgi:hypothetical protein